MLYWLYLQCLSHFRFNRRDPGWHRHCSILLPGTHAPSLWSLNYFTCGLLFPNTVLYFHSNTFQWLSSMHWVHSNRDLSYNPRNFMFCPSHFSTAFAYFSSMWTLSWPSLITRFFPRTWTSVDFFVVVFFPSYLSVRFSPLISISVLTILPRLAIKVI